MEDFSKYDLEYIIFEIMRILHVLSFDVIIKIRDGGFYLDFKVRVLFEKADLFNARGLCNPGKIRPRVFELTY